MSLERSSSNFLATDSLRVSFDFLETVTISLSMKTLFCFLDVLFLFFLQIVVVFVVLFVYQIIIDHDDVEATLVFFV